LAGQPTVLQGQIGSLEGERFEAQVSDGAGTTVDLRVQLQIDNQSNTVTGTMVASPAVSGG
jgi:hypothetical protein